MNKKIIAITLSFLLISLSILTSVPAFAEGGSEDYGFTPSEEEEAAKKERDAKQEEYDKAVLEYEEAQKDLLAKSEALEAARLTHQSKESEYLILCEETDRLIREEMARLNEYEEARKAFEQDPTPEAEARLEEAELAFKDAVILRKAAEKNEIDFCNSDYARTLEMVNVSKLAYKEAVAIAEEKELALGDKKDALEKAQAAYEATIITDAEVTLVRKEYFIGDKIGGNDIELKTINQDGKGRIVEDPDLKYTFEFKGLEVPQIPESLSYERLLAYHQDAGRHEVKILYAGKVVGVENIKIGTVPYIITEGGSVSWDHNSGQDARFVSNADFANFSGVYVDGKPVDPTHYIAVSGSTDVTLKAEYLNTLSAGSHTLDIVSKNGLARATFTVNKPEKEEKQDTPEKPQRDPQNNAKPQKNATPQNEAAPKTADGNAIYLWMSLFAIAMAMLLGLSGARKHN